MPKVHKNDHIFFNTYGIAMKLSELSYNSLILVHAKFDQNWSCLSTLLGHGTDLPSFDVRCLQIEPLVQTVYNLQIIFTLFPNLFLYISLIK